MPTEAEDDHADAVQDALADLGVAVREFAEARRLYEHAIAAVGAAGARMKAAALNEECALEAVRSLHGAPEFVHTPEETPDACTPDVTRPPGISTWRWWCHDHQVGGGDYYTQEAAERAAVMHTRRL
jgi:hypothetical protein